MREDKHCKGGIFKPPLQSLSSYLLRKTRWKIFPSSLLSTFKNVVLLLFFQSTVLVILILSIGVTNLYPL